MLGFACALCFVAAHASSQLRAQEGGQRIDFSGRWQNRWQNVRLADRATRFSVVGDDGTAVLLAASERAAAALWHRVDLPRGTAATVSWRWKIAEALSDTGREREKAGDDYAARFFVVFDGEPFSRRARALCYVWAAGEPVGSVYRNPFFSNVVTIVLQSGNERVGRWIREERDFLRDFEAAFGEPPREVSAVAVMVDTDNTESRATAWFADIDIRSRATHGNQEDGSEPADPRSRPGRGSFEPPAAERR